MLSSRSANAEAVANWRRYRLAAKPGHVIGGGEHAAGEGFVALVQGRDDVFLPRLAKPAYIAVLIDDGVADKQDPEIGDALDRCQGALKISSASRRSSR